MRNKIEINKAVDILASRKNLNYHYDIINNFLHEAVIANDLNGVMLIEGEPIEFIHKGITVSMTWDMISVANNYNDYADLLTPLNFDTMIRRAK